MLFTDRLRKVVDPIWKAAMEHPFVKGIGEGNLAIEKFQFYMIQDYVYLIDYSKLFALGVVKSSKLEQMGKFAELLHSTLNTEMELHRGYAKRLGITLEELENAEPSPYTTAYNHYMLSVAQSGSLGELVAALLPCAWSYCEIGNELSKIPGATEHEFYGDWVKMYSGPEFAELLEWLLDLMNELAEGKSEAELARLEEIFIMTSRFEYTFWNMGYHRTMWPEEISLVEKSL